MSSSNRPKLARKYVIRRTVFLILLAALLGILLWALAWSLLPREDDGKNSSPSSSSVSQSPSSSENGTASSESQDPSSSTQSEPSSISSEPSSAPPPSSSSGATGTEVSGDWKLVLINPTHSISQELGFATDEVQGYKVDARMAPALREMLAAAKADGYSLTIISGYRTIERSRILYQNKVQEYKNAGYSDADAKVEAAKWVAPPGTSEHHTGLAADIISSDYYNKYSDLVEEFENEPEAIWLRENAPRFGFILRFPKDKEEITGIHYEPWHFRYVGVEAAQAITDQGLCLEEYLGEA